MVIGCVATLLSFDPSGSIHTTPKSHIPKTPHFSRRTLSSLWTTSVYSFLRKCGRKVTWRRMRRAEGCRANRRMYVRTTMGKEIQRLHFETAVLGSASLPFFNPSLSDVHFTVENVDRLFSCALKCMTGIGNVNTG